ncbi:adenosylcobinamide amidohydrolase [Pararhodobacter sp. SW119]|uniref:adenosylcobinamide amidohydrolase n=1 Tax=Pararhodobacter sp. SW119 TaxID=2780075 RepID=UPI001AE043BD|nr:adenosylcobinamide amidohydrolase [Pararhodobacter sp. SW119]
MIVLDRPWLSFDLGVEMTVLSWTVNRPGFVRGRHLIWREIRNADLPPDLNVKAWLDAETARLGKPDAPCLLTSRRLDAFVRHDAREGTVAACAVATVGLSNAERVGTRTDRTGRNWDLDLGAHYGTVNVGVRVDHPLSRAGMLEALSIVTEARTAAILDAQVHLPTGLATGTGTDCIAIAAPEGVDDYAGLHTDCGVALGRAVYGAVLAGARDWQSTVGLIRGG